MKTLPKNVVSYKKTPEFTSSSIPRKLLHAHSTKSGVWGKIVVLQGTLLYRILDSSVEESLLSPDSFGVIEPTVQHEVVPQGDCRFYVQFYR